MKFLYWVIKQSLRKFEKWFSALVLNDKVMCFQKQEIVLKEAKFIEFNNSINYSIKDKAFGRILGSLNSCCPERKKTLN